MVAADDQIAQIDATHARIHHETLLDIISLINRDGGYTG
jgi:hypothetical protein